MTIANRLVAGIVAGAVVGSAMGLLVAPKTSKESRRAAAEGTPRWRSRANGVLQDLRQKTREESRGGFTKERRNRHLVITK